MGEDMSTQKRSSRPCEKTAPALAANHPQKPAGVRLTPLPGLDGLRALAVIAVLLYHAGLNWLPGGFLGVEVFFVISGYLISALLLAEWQQAGHISLARFWLRRARRLLPALVVMMVVTLTSIVLFWPAEVAGLRGDALAGFAYCTNWYLVFEQRPYFETIGRPSPWQHLWSLAVEGQFYLLWPLCSVAVLRWRPRALPLVAGLGALASAALMALLYDPAADPLRVYYGTDTRLAGLLGGAMLACIYPPAMLPRRGGRTVALWLDRLGILAAGLLVGCLLWLQPYQPLLYRGGFLVVALATLGSIMMVVHPCAFVGWGLLAWPLLRRVGLRSYSIYLWHWPVYVFTRPQLDLPLDGLPLLVLRLVLTGLLAELSYRYVETPFRTGAIERSWHRLGEAYGVQGWWLGLRWATVSAAGAAFAVMLGLSVAQARPPAPPPYLLTESIRITPRAVAPSPSPATAMATMQPAATPRLLPTADRHPARIPANKPGPLLSSRLLVTTITVVPASPTPAPLRLVTAVGDSVMLGAASQLAMSMSSLDLDAAVSRQADVAIAILQARRDAGQLGDVVVVHIGNNGYFAPEQFDQMMQILSGVPRVVIVNTNVPRPWEAPNNSMLAEGVSRYPNAVLADWYAVSNGRAEFFWEDGYHLRPEGARVYTELILAHLGGP